MEARIEKVVGRTGRELPQLGKGWSSIICLGNSDMMELHDRSDVCVKCPMYQPIPIRPAAKARRWERTSGIGTLSIDQGSQWRLE